MTIIEVHRARSHDGCVAIYHGGEIYALAGERVDRVKHSIYAEPALTFLIDRLRIKQQGLGASDLSHPLAHAASAYYPSPYDEAIVVVIDGQGPYNDTSVVATTVWRGRGSDLMELDAWPVTGSFCANSLGHFYSAITYLLGFGFYDQGKTMALAAYGVEGSLVEYLRGMCKFENGTITVDEMFIRAIFHMIYGRQFGWPDTNAFDSILTQIQEMLGPFRHPGDPIEQRHCDLAKAAQNALEETLVGFCKHLQSEYAARHLCLAGGVALNVSTNSRIVKEAGFEGVFIQPAAGDDGQALGKLLYRMHHDRGLQRRGMTPYLGPPYDTEDFENVLCGSAFEIERTPYETALCDSITKRLAAGQVLAWFQGRSEIGPRALGNRSILASPVDASMRERINKHIKHRELFQPFALSLLPDAARELFGLDIESPYMLLVGHATERAKTLMPSGIHVDGSSRIQTVTAESNGRLFRLLSSFESKTGIPGLINTSFNDKGDPIVETPQNAIDTFTKMSGLDALVLREFLVTRK